jgi:hypothetical protein
MSSDLDLTAEEHALLQRWCAQSSSVRLYLGYYGAILLPMIAFAIYGFLKRDAIALSIAFAGLLIYQLYRIATDFDRSGLYRSLFKKLAARELAKSEC